MCIAHDPETRLAAQRAGGEASAERSRAKFLTRAEADKIINLRDRRRIPATIELVARAVACNELDKGAGNAILVAANAAVGCIVLNEKADEKHAADLNDEQLEEAMEAFFRERHRREAQQ